MDTDPHNDISLRLLQLSSIVAKRNWSTTMPNALLVKRLLQATILIADNPGNAFIFYEGHQRGVESHDCLVILKQISKPGSDFQELGNLLITLRNLVPKTHSALQKFAY